MTEVLDSADNPARKAWLRSLISKVEVDTDRIRIVGSKEVLNAAVASSATQGENVQSCVPKWRAKRDSNSTCDYRSRSDLEFELCIIHIQI